MSDKKNIPYKIYLEEIELPKQWYNVRADMKNKPAPLLNPGTGKPVTLEEMSGIFCEELAKQELDDTTAYIDIPEEIHNFYKMYRPAPLVRAYYLEKYLDQAIRDNAVGNRTVGIVMNVNTFEVLAMATRNAFDPNDPFTIADEEKAAEIAALPEDEQAAAISAAQSLQWRNKAISDPYEPGSVFKTFTASAALDEGVVSLTSSFTCTGNTRLGGVRYQCNNGHVHGTQNIVQAMENSCNLAFMQIGQALGIPAFTRYYESFGFTAKTGIDLPGEAAPVAGVHYHVPSAMGITELASSSFGQSRKMTPIQMITAACAVVNGGRLMRPYLVVAILD